MPLAHHRDHVARAYRRSGPLGVFEAVSSTPTPSTYAQNTVAGIAPSVRIGSIIAGVLSAMVLVGALLLWKYKDWNKRKNMRSAALESKISTEKNCYTYFGQEKIDLSSSVYVEKPKAVYGSELSSPESDIGWAPQITNYRGIQMTPKQLQNIKSSPKKYAKWEKSLQLSRERSPPPYSCEPSMVPLPPTPPETPKRSPPTPPTPPATKSRALLPLGNTPSGPLPSPSRSTSFVSQMQKSSESLSNQKPHLMKVVNVFTPSRDDEIPITIGETVRLVEEYQDGWCFIQTKDSRTGVVPRFCLVDRPSSRSYGSKSSN